MNMITIASYEGGQKTRARISCAISSVSWAIFLRLSNGSVYSFDKETGIELHPSSNVEWRIEPEDLRYIQSLKESI